MKYDILSILQSSATLQIEGNVMNGAKNSQIRRYGVRRFEDGKQFQSSRIGAATEEQLLAESREWGGPGSPHDHGFAPAANEKRAGKTVAREAAEDFEGEVMDLARRNPSFVFSGKCSVVKREISLKSNYGLDLETRGDHCEWYLIYQRKGSGNVFDGYVEETSATPNIRAALAEHEPYLQAQAKPVKLANGRMPILFVEPAQPLGKLIESFSVHRYKEGSCVFAGKLGESLFSPKVTLLDQAYDPGHGQIQFFDGEGTVRGKDALPLIDRGRFASLITDLRFGKKYGLPTTGNGVRAFNSGVGVGLRGLRVQAGERPWRQILSGLDRCIVAFMASGGDSNDLGEFSTPVQVSYVFEKGQLVGMAPQITVKTSVADYLGKNLIDVSSDGFTPTASSACVISEVDVLVN